MKKIVSVIIACFSLMIFFISCSESSPSNPGTGVSGTPTPMLIDDFEDSDTINELGGYWTSMDDSDFGGGNTVNSISISSGSTLGTTTGSLALYPEYSQINTFIADQPSGYYGFVSLFTDLPSGRNLSNTTGLRFHLKTYYKPTDTEDRISVWIGSVSEITDGIYSRYRASVTVATGGEWAQYEIPWSSFTLGYVFDSGYPSHAQTKEQVLEEVSRIGFDKEYHYSSAGIPPSSWSQIIYVDDVTVY
ncbi:MAG: CIA30 family protein [Candidatus Goldbacteria bacterium]|nr:CIA30 family protein [Candidatus Goldiibacteriota bacterium]